MYAGKTVVLKISGDGLPITSGLSTTDDTIYQITNAAQRVLNPDNLIVQVDGSAPTEPYVINYLNGTITFQSADTRDVTVTGEYLPMTAIGSAREASHSEECALLDASVFGVEYVKRTQGLKSASGTITEIDITDTTFLDALREGKPVILEDRADESGEPNRWKILLEEIEESADVTDLQTRTISWSSTDEWIRLGG